METFTYDNLLAGDQPIATEDVLIQSGQSLASGAVVGRVKVSVPTTGTADGGNTGNGTCTAVAGGKNTKKGTYTVECTRAVTNGGEFEIIDPDGKFIGKVLITAGAGGTGVFKSDELSCTLTDGSTDFAIGDKFTVAVSDGVPTTGTLTGTGNGTLTLVEGRSGLKVGTYTVECVTAVTNGGVFSITDPDGNVLDDDITIPPGAGNSIAFETDQIAGTITDGSTDFVAGDSFTVVVTIDPRQVKLLDKTATDGSSMPFGVLVKAVDATSEAKRSVVYRTGAFNERALSFASGTDVEDIRKDMEFLNMYVRKSVAQ